MSQLKWLTGIRLINWHYFVNETIRLRGSTLLTGDNGSGKSTILDAIQFVLIADQRRARFNISAHDETNRDLKGYLRCRTGRDDPEGEESQGYLRSGDFTSYVVLEFHDTARNDHILLGVGIDTFAGEPDTPQFFRLSGALDDALFLQGDRPLSVTEFKAVLRQRRGAEVFGSAAAYRTALKAQLGHLDDRFFSLLIKALAFHPITDVRRFVYDYVLDEREVRIDAMLDNFQQYRHYDNLVAQTKEKLARLGEIREKHQAKADLEAAAAIQQYLILRAAREALREKLDGLGDETAAEQRRKAAAEAEQERLGREIDRLDRELRELQDARARDDAYQALQSLDRQIQELGREAADLEQQGLRLVEDARREVRALNAAVRLAERHAAVLALEDEAAGAADLLAALADAAARLEPLARGNTDASPADLSALAPALERLSDRTVLREGKLKEEERALQAERRELDETLDALRRHKIRYPRAVEALREAIRQGLAGVEARVLCELIDIPDERWQNAVEGYLNTQRFDLFVPPDAFDAALAVYERSKVELRIESVGLVNSEALLRSRPAAVPGSLAGEVATADAAARADERASGRLRQLADDARALEAQWQAQHEQLEAYCRDRPEAAEQGAARYLEIRHSRSNDAIVQNYGQSRQGLLTQADNLGRELYRLRLDYNSRHLFGGAAEDPGNDAYEAEHRKLTESELPAYEEKIAHARSAAEAEFKEHFIFKLQENIHLARQEFDNLNRVLREIPFGQDRYQFTCSPDRTYRAFYDMIMDEYAVEGLDLFSLHFREKHGESLDELFRLILDVPEDRQVENIRRYTDYRTYLEYDIKIHHANGETSSFSRVAREKSGGETQTPYYVAIVASFLQLYRPRQNPHTVRLMMFDEAFNRMDPDRAENTLQFIRKLGLQVVAAAPTDKCEIITPHVETTLLLMRDGHRAWLEDYHQVLAAPGAAEVAAGAAEAAPTAEAGE